MGSGWQMIAGGRFEMERAMEGRQSRCRSLLWACGNGGATMGLELENQGLSSRTTTPQKATKAKVPTAGGVGEAIIRYFRKDRVKLETSCPCWRRLFGPAFALSFASFSPSLSPLSGGGGPRGRSVWTPMRHGGMAAWTIAGEGPPDPLGQCSMFPLSSVLAGHLVARLGR